MSENSLLPYLQAYCSTNCNYLGGKCELSFCVTTRHCAIKAAKANDLRFPCKKIACGNPKVCRFMNKCACEVANSLNDQRNRKIIIDNLLAINGNTENYKLEIINIVKDIKHADREKKKFEHGNRLHYIVCKDGKISTTLVGPGNKNQKIIWEDCCCRKCGSRERLNIDHIKPVSKGGTNERSNLQTYCQDCNTRKGNSYHKYNLKHGIK